MRLGTCCSQFARRLVPVLGAGLLGLGLPATAAERELEQETAPSSAEEIDTPIQIVFPRPVELPALFPWLPEQLENLPPFLADTQLGVRFRTYYLRKDRAIDLLSEAWAIGGSLYYRSGWLADTFAVEVEGFTSQPIYALDGRGGTGLLTLDQQGYSALGIANAKLRYAGIQLTGYRQYLDLPYVNREDSRMTPNTFEAITLAKPEGKLRFSTGYAWKIKRRTSETFVPMSEAIGVSQERGLVHGGVVWDPTDKLHVGAVVGAVPDVFAGGYGELGLVGTVTGGLEARIDTQFTYEGPIGDRLLGLDLNETWNLGIRGSSSWKGAVLRLGGSFTGAGGSVPAPYGSNPSYLNLMQRVFDRANEKALLASFSYDFSILEILGLSFIVNYAAGFDGELLGVRGNAQEVDVTLDYRLTSGPLRSLWLRVRGSWLRDELADRDATDVRVILRYDIPVL